MNFTNSGWNKWISKVENLWFYLKNPSLISMTFNTENSLLEVREDFINFDLEA